MATLVATNAWPIDMTNATLANLNYASITISTATQIRASWWTTSWVDFYGSFAYANGSISGVLNRAIEVSNGTAIYDLSGVSINAGTFLSYVNNGADYAAKRAIFGGNDAIYGSDYGDYFEYVGGNDYFDGKGGTDTVVISDGYGYNGTSPEAVVLPEGSF